MLPSPGFVSVWSATLLAVLLVGLWAAGSAVLLRVGRGDGDQEGLRDGAVALGLPVGLLLLAFPGWLLTVIGRVPFAAILAIGGAVAAALLVLCGRGLDALRSRRALVSSRTPAPVHALVPGLVLLGL